MLYDCFVGRFWKLSLGDKKGLQVLYSQPFSSVIRIVLYVLRLPAAAGRLSQPAWFITPLVVVGHCC